MPKGTYFPQDKVRPWETPSADEKRLFSRMAEVIAGFSEYTDVQIGRMIDYLEESGQLDNTLIFYCADNRASGEDGPNGSVNENKFFNMYPDDITVREDEAGFARQLQMIGVTLKDGFQYETLDAPTIAGLKRAVPDGQTLAAHKARALMPVQPGGTWTAGSDLHESR